MQQNRLLHLYAPFVTLVALAGICLGFVPLVHAQELKLGPSPLDTLMHTKIWADVPEAKDFVRETRRPPDNLTYQPVTGTDPERPKLKSKAELEALENELERAATRNNKKAGKLPSIKKPAAITSVKRE